MEGNFPPSGTGQKKKKKLGNRQKVPFCYCHCHCRVTFSSFCHCRVTFSSLVPEALAKPPLKNLKIHQHLEWKKRVIDEVVSRRQNWIWRLWKEIMRAWAALKVRFCNFFSILEISNFWILSLHSKEIGPEDIGVQTRRWKLQKERSLCQADCEASEW